MLNNREFPAKLEYLPAMLEVIRREIAPFIKNTKQQKRLELCAEEILANIIEYAYPSIDGSIFISVKYSEKQHQLYLIFADNGIPYNPLNQTDKKSITTLEDQPVGGLGIFLYTTIMDGAKYEYQNGMNQLTVWKNL